ncbi:anthranilate synthase / indole-3-glycerol phosphate synthase [Massospora cicadina]|nr:anthranilate synthase / indole-3-glycerol phosphate synthase [Massospora cicadina]
MSPKGLTILIDNYDSFTWNVYQYLCKLGARVQVFRNDKVDLSQLIELRPSNLVISPGPGSPATSSGISMAAIRHFAGKIPILGVCLGLQCMYELFGGTVGEVGHIVHGKTSELIHDGAGLYRDVPQRSACLSQAIPRSGVIQGVRHRKYCMEGVQFHPESVISENGMSMISNFLSWTQGTWEKEGENVPNISLVMPGPIKAGEENQTPKDSILLRIAAKRREDILEAKALPGQSLDDLKEMVSMNFSPPALDFYARLAKDPSPLPVLAELKRASPSKGDINLKVNIARQALTYASAGAAAISVLTEPKWFKGSLNDLRQVREVVASLRFTLRPAILRKDFIVDSYQVYESRLYGADTLLLIVAILSREKLFELLQLSRSLGMEPLVEVNNSAEMALAVEVGAKVIGVNNRNLHDFKVDMATTSRLADQVPSGVILIALSGINTPHDAAVYSNTPVRAVLVGEALMRASDPKSFITTLSGRSTVHQPKPASVTKVKICGLQTVDAAVCAAQSGADFIGLVFAPSKRKVDMETARRIVRAVRLASKTVPRSSSPTLGTWFDHQRALVTTGHIPKIVGVFKDQPAEEINAIATAVGLDYVQLHGSEPLELSQKLPFPSIKVFHVGEDFDQPSVLAQAASPNLHSLVLLDTQAAPGVPGGGLGKPFDWNLAANLVDALSGPDSPPVILAGGLTLENVAEAIRKVRPYAVDVSSGVEVDGEKDTDLIRAFINACKCA